MNAASRPAIVLASRSPRRLELARAEGWLVTVTPPDEAVEADQPPRGPGESLAAFVQRLAFAKAEAVAATGAEGTIVACDTLSEVAGTVLGKPADATEARRMLQALSGRRHRVLTGVCVWHRPDGRPRQGVAESLLEMGPLSEDFLAWYLASGLWVGKAGACGFQDERLPLALVAGSPSNVVGLPLELLREMLAGVGESERRSRDETGT
ncbi:MAG: Maf family protein [Planctomycetia bacterium]